MFMLWNADGDEICDEYPPWEPRDLLRNPEKTTFKIGRIVAKLQEISGSDVVALHQLAENHYIVIDASMTDGAHYIVRIVNTTIPINLSFSKDKLRRECEFMRWISSSSPTPMPLVYHCDANLATPYMITNRCEGRLLIDSFGILPLRAKMANIHSYAQIALNLFRIEAPDGIGSVSSFPSIGHSPLRKPVLGPFILPSGLCAPSAIFRSIMEYFSWLIGVKVSSHTVTVGTKAPDLEQAKFTLKRLEQRVSESITTCDAALLRSVPSHEDFSAQNVFINDDSGVITGVIDWEFHMVKPALMAAAYPSWIRYDGALDPRFVDNDGQFSSFWVTSPVDAAKLRKEFDVIVRKEDPEYYSALKTGEFCRAAEQWLIDDRMDIGCRRMKAWLDSFEQHVIKKHSFLEVTGELCRR